MGLAGKGKGKGGLAGLDKGKSKGELASKGKGWSLIASCANNHKQCPSYPGGNVHSNMKL